MAPYLRQFMMPQLQHRGRQFRNAEVRPADIAVAGTQEFSRRPEAVPAAR